MDMTYFSFTPQSLKQRNLKIAIVFIHETCSFEAWLGGYNKQIQQKYWKLFKDVRLNKLTILEFTITANNDDRTINWISYFISRPKQSGWNKYHIVSTTKGVDSIIESILADNPDFSDLNAVTKQIESGTLKFIKDVERFLSRHEN